MRIRTPDVQTMQLQGLRGEVLEVHSVLSVFIFGRILKSRDCRCLREDSDRSVQDNSLLRSCSCTNPGKLASLMCGKRSSSRDPRPPVRREEKKLFLARAGSGSDCSGSFQS